MDGTYGESIEKMMESRGEEEWRIKNGEIYMKGQRP